METKGKEAKPRFGIVNFERRKYPRFSIDLPIEYYKIDTPTSHSGRAANISEGGLLIYLPEVAEVGQRLKVRLFLHRFLNQYTQWKYWRK
jgi:c-di-GMP-binding flagellar brake protein YcgR